MKIKVKIAVGANPNGEWYAYGFPQAESWEECTDAFELLEGEQRFWVEAEIEVADETTVVVGTVTTAE